MLTWLAENWGTILVLAIVLGAVIWSGAVLYRDRKNGCASCGGNCAHCGACRKSEPRS